MKKILLTLALMLTLASCSEPDPVYDTKPESTCTKNSYVLVAESPTGIIKYSYQATVDYQPEIEGVDLLRYLEVETTAITEVEGTGYTIQFKTNPNITQPTEIVWKLYTNGNLSVIYTGTYFDYTISTE